MYMVIARVESILSILMAMASFKHTATWNLMQEDGLCSSEGRMVLSISTGTGMTM